MMEVYIKNGEKHITTGWGLEVNAETAKDEIKKQSDIINSKTSSALEKISANEKKEELELALYLLMK